MIDKEGGIVIGERSLRRGSNFKNDLTGFLRLKSKGLTEFEIGVIQRKSDIGVGNEIVVSNRTVIAGRKKRKNLGVEGNFLIGFIGNLIGLGKGDPGFENKFNLRRSEREIKGHKDKFLMSNF